MRHVFSHPVSQLAVLAGLVVAQSAAEAQERYPFEGAWSDLTNKCQEPANLQLRYFRDHSQSDSGNCSYRKVRQQGVAFVLDVECDEGEGRFRATERISIEGDRMMRTRKVPWSNKPFSTTLQRCDRPQAAAPAPAPAAAASGASHPVQVAAWVDESIKTCREDGGQPVAGGDHVRSADIDGDGRPDYLIDDGKFQCRGATNRSCGSHGCSVEVFLSAGGYRAAGLDLLAYGSTIEPKGNKPVVVIETRGGTFRYAWNGKALARR